MDRTERHELYEAAAKIVFLTVAARLGVSVLKTFLNSNHTHNSETTEGYVIVPPEDAEDQDYSLTVRDEIIDVQLSGWGPYSLSRATAHEVIEEAEKPLDL